MNQLRTVIKYPGSKWKIADWIISQMPPHKSYLEPYFGSGAVFFRKSPSRIETVNDIDGEIVNLFRCIQSDAKKLADMVAAIPYSRRVYDDAFTNDSADPFERACIFLVQSWQGHGFRTGAYKSGWKNDVSGREYAYAVRYWNNLPDWILQIVIRLKEAQIECLPATKLIKRFNSPDVLIYADPPYVLSTRHMKKQYTHEMSDADHLELLEVLLQHRGPVLLSGYENEFYNDILHGWDKRQMGSTAEKGKHRIETLWMNFHGQMSLF